MRAICDAYMGIHKLWVFTNESNNYRNGMYMPIFAFLFNIIAPYYDTLSQVLTQGFINHPWYLAPLAYADLMLFMRLL